MNVMNGMFMVHYNHFQVVQDGRTISLRYGLCPTNLRPCEVQGKQYSQGRHCLTQEIGDFGATCTTGSTLGKISRFA